MSAQIFFNLNCWDSRYMAPVLPTYLGQALSPQSPPAMWAAGTFLALSLTTSLAHPLNTTQQQIPDGPPFLWRLIGDVLKGVFDPLDRGLPQDACSTFCHLPTGVKSGLAAIACGGALVAKSWTGLVCPVSLNHHTFKLSCKKHFFLSSICFEIKIWQENQVIYDKFEIGANCIIREFHPNLFFADYLNAMTLP